MKILLFALLVFGTVRSDLLLRSQMNIEDLNGNSHLNDMIANTLNNQHHYFKPTDGLASGEPVTFSTAYEYKILEFTKEKLVKAIDLFSHELGHSFQIVSSELAHIAEENTSELWQTYIYLQVTEQLCRPTVAFIRWDKDAGKFDVHFLKAKKAFAVGFQQSHLVRYSSLFGTEAGEATLIADESTDEAAFVYEASKRVLVSAVGELAQRRGVDPKNPAAEVYFRNYMDKKKMLKVDPVTMVIAAAIVVQLAAKVWQLFASIFATKVTTTLIGEFKSKGFSSFSLTASVRRYTGIKGSEIGTFTTVVTRIMTNDHPDKEKQRKIKANLELVQFIDSNTWNMDDIAVDTGRPDSSDRFFTIMYNNENYGEKYNFLAMNVQSTFTLAPNLLIYKQNKSVFGGIVGSEKIVIEEVPRTVTKTDVEAMRAFNLVMACKLFADNLPGDKLAWPNMPM